METKDTEQHPFAPFIPANAKVLIMGSFPPSKERWSMEFYYPNLNNDMWRIMGIVFFGRKEYLFDETDKAFRLERIVEFLTDKGIAVFDTAAVVRRLRGNASDKDLEIVEPVDIRELLSRMPACEAIVTTGQKATDPLLSQLNVKNPKTGGYSDFSFEGRPMKLFRMPSTSRAYRRKVEYKAGIYRTMFREVGIVSDSVL